MKLASYQDGSRDGHLIVVSRDLRTAHYASGIATRMQAVLDDWNFLAPQLETLYEQLNAGRARHAFPFEPARCLAPLPRAYQWTQLAPSTATGHHPAPVLGTTHPWFGARASWPVHSGPDLHARVMLALATCDLPPGCEPAQAMEGIRLVLLATALVAAERHGGQGDAGVTPAGATPSTPYGPLTGQAIGTIFAPVAVTTDELGPNWHAGQSTLRIECHVDGRACGRVPAGALWPQAGHWVAQALAHRPGTAGSLIGVPLLTDAGEPLGWQLSQQEPNNRSAQETAPPAPEPRRAPQSAAMVTPPNTLKLDAVDEQRHSLFGAIIREPVGLPMDAAPTHHAAIDASTPVRRPAQARERVRAEPVATPAQPSTADTAPGNRAEQGPASGTDRDHG